MHGMKCIYDNHIYTKQIYLKFFWPNSDHGQCRVGTRPTYIRWEVTLFIGGGSQISKYPLLWCGTPTPSLYWEFNIGGGALLNSGKLCNIETLISSSHRHHCHRKTLSWLVFMGRQIVEAMALHMMLLKNFLLMSRTRSGQEAEEIVIELTFCKAGSSHIFTCAQAII